MKSLRKLTVDNFVFDYMGSVIGNHTIVSFRAVPPKQLMRHNKHKNLNENAKLSKKLNLKSGHALVYSSLLSTNMVQSFFDGHDGEES